MKDSVTDYPFGENNYSEIEVTYSNQILRKPVLIATFNPGLKDNISTRAGLRHLRRFIGRLTTLHNTYAPEGEQL